MARDGTYQPAVYRKQGGDVLVVGTTLGILEVDTGGSVTISTGASLTSAGTITNSGTLANSGAITNTGTITNSSDGQIRESVEIKTTAGAITAYGVSLVGSSTAGARAYTLVKPPAAGVRKTIICKGSTGACIVRCSSLGTLNYSANRKITFAANADGYAIELLATTSTNWQAIRMSTAQVTTVAFGTS